MLPLAQIVRQQSGIPIGGGGPELLKLSSVSAPHAFRGLWCRRQSSRPRLRPFAARQSSSRSLPTIFARRLMLPGLPPLASFHPRWLVALPPRQSFLTTRSIAGVATNFVFVFPTAVDTKSAQSQQLGETNSMLVCTPGNTLTPLLRQMGAPFTAWFFSCHFPNLENWISVDSCQSE